MKEGVGEVGNNGDVNNPHLASPFIRGRNVVYNQPAQYTEFTEMN